MARQVAPDPEITIETRLLSALVVEPGTLNGLKFILACACIVAADQLEGLRHWLIWTQTGDWALSLLATAQDALRCAGWLGLVGGLGHKVIKFCRPSPHSI